MSLTCILVATLGDNHIHWWWLCSNDTKLKACEDELRQKTWDDGVAPSSPVIRHFWGSKMHIIMFVYWPLNSRLWKIRKHVFFQDYSTTSNMQPRDVELSVWGIWSDALIIYYTLIGTQLECKKLIFNRIFLYTDISPFSI